MIEKKSKRGAWITLILSVAVLLLVVLAENIGTVLPLKIFQPTSMLFTVLKKGAVYSLVAVSMNLLNGFTGLFSLGQAGFMLLGAYTYSILTVPTDVRDSVYYLYGGSAIHFSLQEMFGSLFGNTGAGGAISLVLGVLLGLLLAGCVAAFFAWLIGLPVLRLRSDYLAIATLGFAEILRAIFQWQALGPVTNGANMIKSFPTFSNFNIKGADGSVVLYLSTFVPFLVVMLCIVVVVLLINSSYGRAFKAIREDEIAAEAMGINLPRHKMLSFCISAFFAGIGGALFAMYANNAQAMVYTSSMTYEILLIVVIGGIGSISGSVIASFLYIACSEWWLRFLDQETILTTGGRTQFIAVMAVIFVILLALMVFRLVKPKGKSRIPYGVGAGVCAAVLGWLVYFAATGQTKVPLLRNGFRMVVFSIIIMIVVLFFRRGIMGTKELPDLFKKRKKAVKEEVAK